MRLLRLWGDLTLELLLLLLLLLLGLLSVAEITRGRLLEESGDVHGWTSGAVGSRWTPATGARAARTKTDVVVGEGKGRKM